MRIYYFITFGINIAAAIIFRKSIAVSALSVVPLFLIAMTALQACLFKGVQTEEGYRTNYGSSLTADEENQRNEYVSRFMLAMIPLMIPFVIFFPSPFKLFSLLIYFIGLIGGALIYRAKHKRDIIRRIDEEEKDRIEQEKKEELGFLK